MHLVGTDVLEPPQEVAQLGGGAGEAGGRGQRVDQAGGSQFM